MGKNSPEKSSWGSGRRAGAVVAAAALAAAAGAAFVVKYEADQLGSKSDGKGPDTAISKTHSRPDCDPATGKILLKVVGFTREQFNKEALDFPDDNMNSIPNLGKPKPPYAEIKPVTLDTYNKDIPVKLAALGTSHIEVAFKVPESSLGDSSKNMSAQAMEQHFTDGVNSHFNVGYNVPVVKYDPSTWKDVTRWESGKPWDKTVHFSAVQENLDSPGIIGVVEEFGTAQACAEVNIPNPTPPPTSTGH